MKDIEYTNNIYGILWVKLKRQKGMRTISLSTRQKRIAEIVRQDGPANILQKDLMLRALPCAVIWPFW